MADIFEEVEEGLRQDRFGEAWKKYGIFAYIGVALLLGGVGLYEYMQHRSTEALTQTTQSLEAAIANVEDGNYEEADQALTTLLESDSRQSAIAGHYLAGVEVTGKGDQAAAIEALLTTIDGEVDDPSEKMALVKAAYLQADTMSLADLETFLEPLRNADTQFGALATELIASKAVEEGDYGFARKEFNYLNIATNAPAGVQRRAQQALETLPPAVIVQNTETQTDTPSEEENP